MKKYGSYGARELVSLLICLGYSKGKQVGSSHLKYFPPNKVPTSVCHFILVIQNVSEYDPYWQREYIKQIQKHNFTINQIDNCFP